MVEGNIKQHKMKKQRKGRREGEVRTESLN